MGNRTRGATAHKRRGFWYLVRRVPQAFSDIDGRGLITISTGLRVADDPQGHRAREIVAELDAALLKRWHELKASRESNGEALYALAVNKAAELGLRYMEAAEVAQLPKRDLVNRIALLKNPVQETDAAVSAVLGGVERPRLMVSGLRDAFESLEATTMAEKSPRQLEKWRNGRNAAISAFIDAIGGDKLVASLTREDILAYRSALQQRAARQEITIETANSMLGRVGAMYRLVNEGQMLGLPPLFDKVAIRGAKTNRRTPYPIDFVQSRLLADGVFDDVNDEARRVLYLIVETGLRLSEACNLNSKTIILDHAVPHVRIRPDGRQMKTDQSQRDIPLVGVSLMAMRAQPEGFPRYHDKADGLSALINKVLDARNLRPNGETLYSLRHTFKDRLRAAGATDELKDALMGHKRDEPMYGFGYSLESKAEVLARMAFKPPRSV